MSRRSTGRAATRTGVRGGEVPWWRRAGALAAAMAMAAGAAACADEAKDPLSGGSGDDERDGSAGGPLTVEPAGDRLAEVDGVGAVHAGTVADPSALTVTATRSAPLAEAADQPALEAAGMLAAGEGLDVTVVGDLSGDLEVRLVLPEAPTDTAIPAVVHVDGEGVVHVEPALWDPSTNEAVVTVDSFSPRWASWWAPDRWLADLWEGIEPIVDPVSDFLTGRTDPPACGNRPPWAGEPRRVELDSVHVCVQSNPADDGTPRAEVLLTSNRNTGQLVVVPAALADYVWVDGQPDFLRPVLTDIVGGNPGDILLLGGQQMTWGHRQPQVDTEVEALVYQTPTLGVLNQVFGLFGVGAADEATAIVLSAYECVRGVTGVDIGAADPVPDGFDSVEDFVGRTLPCVLDQLADPDRVVAGADEILSDAGIAATDRNELLARLRRPLDRFAGLAGRLAAVLGLASAVVHTWDAIWDNLAEGKLTLPLTGSRSTGAAPITPASVQGPATMVVLDTSGSMADVDDKGQVKIDAAKQSLLDYLGAIAPDTTIGLRTYPGATSGCDAGLPAFDLAPRDPADMSAYIRGLTADGDTPTAEALLAAAEDLRRAGITKANVVLLSDGEHTCDDPCAAAAEIRQSGIDVRVISVGFVLSDAGKEELRCIADETGGTYIDAADTEDLATVIGGLTAPRLELSVDHPDSVVADVGTSGWVDITATVTNVSELDAREVSARLRVDEGASPGMVAPDRPLGNLAPGASTTVPWRFRPALSAAGTTFRFTAIASSPDSADVEVSGEIRIADGTTRASAGPLLADADRVAILGDSFSSGEGTSDYIDGTDRPGEPDRNVCHRSRRTYLVEALDIPDELILACSGATAKEHILGHNWGNGEPPQVQALRDQQEAGGPVDAVVLTLGGNDASFGTFVRACAVPGNWSWGDALGGRAPDITPPCDQTVGGQPTDRWVDERFAVGNLSDPLVDAYVAISQTINEPRWVEERGSIAPVIVLAYPRILPYGRRSCLSLPTLSEAEMRYANDEFITRLNGEVEGAVQRAHQRGHPVEFVAHTEGVMQPDHTVCDADASYAVRPTDIVGPEGRAEMLHPNADGYTAMTRGILSWSNTDAADRWADPRPDAPLRVPAGGTIGEALAGADDAAQVLQPAGDPVSLGPGAVVELRVDGFAPESAVELRVESDPMILGEAYADDEGQVSATTALPHGLSAGRHEVIVAGYAPDGSVRDVRLPIDVTRRRSWGWVFLLGAALASLAMLVAGGLVLRRLPSSRRSRAPAPQPMGGRA
jgi:hypothetical protein